MYRLFGSTLRFYVTSRLSMFLLRNFLTTFEFKGWSQISHTSILLTHPVHQDHLYKLRLVSLHDILFDYYFISIIQLVPIL